MVFLGLSRETADQTGTKENIRDLTAQLANNVHKLLLGGAASHTFQHAVAGMLNRKIQIMADLLLFLHGLNQFIINLLRITV